MKATGARLTVTSAGDRIMMGLFIAATVNLLAIAAYPLVDVRASAAFEQHDRSVDATGAAVQGHPERSAQAMPLPCQQERVGDRRARGCKELLRWQQDQLRRDPDFRPVGASFVD